MLQSMMWVFAITGGPCAGKSTLMAFLRQRLGEMGYHVFVVPETATLLFEAGAKLGENGVPRRQFQEVIMRLVLQLEEEIKLLAKAIAVHKPVIVLCDRGTMDPRPYMSEEDFHSIVAVLGTNIAELRDSRYSAVLHLVTAADGALEFYTCANNAARTETSDQARTLDRATLAAWVGHPHLRVIDNSTDFPGKMKRALAEICHVLGVPEPLERERKFLVRKASFENAGVPYRTVDIMQTYLQSADTELERRVRSRSDGAGAVHFYTEKRKVGPGVRIETERIIPKDEYDALITARDMRFRQIMKKRTCFVWDRRYFEYDDFSGFDLQLLEIESSTPDEQLVLPPFIEVVKEVTDNDGFSNRELARL